jgi:hypothetical protein
MIFNSLELNLKKGGYFMRKTLSCLIGFFLLTFLFACSSKNYEGSAKTEAIETAEENKKDAKSEKESKAKDAGEKAEAAEKKAEKGIEKAESTMSTAADYDINIEKAVIAQDVENLAPVGESSEFSKDVDKIYCFSKVTGVEGEATIKHKWYFGEKLAAEIPLRIKSSSWRTYSSKTIVPEFAGNWKVEITTEDDKVLETLDFEIK